MVRVLRSQTWICVCFVVLATGSDASFEWLSVDVQQAPSARFGHALANDNVRGELVLFGGVTAKGSLCSDTWIWSDSTWRSVATEMTPDARHRHSMVGGDEGKLVLFGGIGSSQRHLNDTWIWDGESWNQGFPIHIPPARSGSALAYDSMRKEVVLFGGQGIEGPLNDTWVWDGADWLPRSVVSSPSARVFHSMGSSPSGELLLFGGQNVSGEFLSDTWIWDGSGWENLGLNKCPPARARAVLAYDESVELTLLFGGSHPFDAGVPVADTWAWDGTSWRELATKHSPSARMNSAMAYDTFRQRSVLLGGLGANGPGSDMRGNVVEGEPLSDTWVLQSTLAK